VSRTLRIVLAAVIAVVAVGGYWKLALAPKRAEAADLHTQIASAEAQVAQTQGTIAAYQDAKAAYKDNYATVVRLGKAVPADDDTRSLVVQLDTAAKRSGIDFDNIDITSSGASSSATATATGAPATDTATLAPGAVNVGSFAAMPFNFAFTGRFDGLSNFVSRLERFVTVQGDRINVNGRLLRVDGISLQPADEGWPGLQVQIAASTYIVPAGQDATQGATGTATAPSTATTTTDATASTGTTDSTSTTTTTSAGSDLR
jgi:Tfp pilus assembly protein PilO